MFSIFAKGLIGVRKICLFAVQSRRSKNSDPNSSGILLIGSKMNKHLVPKLSIHSLLLQVVPEQSLKVQVSNQICEFFEARDNIIIVQINKKETYSLEKEDRLSCKLSGRFNSFLFCVYIVYMNALDV